MKTFFGLLFFAPFMMAVIVFFCVHGDLF